LRTKFSRMTLLCNRQTPSTASLPIITLQGVKQLNNLTITLHGVKTI
jgi:hypothetical protein